MGRALLCLFPLARQIKVRGREALGPGLMSPSSLPLSLPRSSLFFPFGAGLQLLLGGEEEPEYGGAAAVTCMDVWCSSA